MFLIAICILTLLKNDLSFCFVLFCNETKITATKIDQNNEEYKKCLNLN